MLPVNAQTSRHPGGFHSQEALAAARKEIATGSAVRVAAFELLMEQADLALNTIPNPVEDFNVPGFYRDAAGHNAAKKRLSADVWAAYSCSVAYQLLEGDARLPYAEKSAELLVAWANKNRTTGDGDGDLAMAYVATGFVFAAELLADYHGWEAEGFTAVKHWVRTVYLKSCSTIVGRANNWGDWGLVGSMASHYFLDDEVGLESDIELLREKIDHSIAADGHMPLEVKRGKNSLWYTYFSLSPLTACCEIARNSSGVDLYRYVGKGGAGIETALDYFIHYCREPGDWPHYRESDLRIPAPSACPGNLFEAMSVIYGKEAYGTWVEANRPIMLYDHHFTWSLPTLLRPKSLLT